MFRRSDRCAERNLCTRPAGGGRLASAAQRRASRAPVRGAVAPLVPQKESFLGGSFSSHGPIAQPPASVLSRPVVARLTPAPRQPPLHRVSRPLQLIPANRLTQEQWPTLRQSGPASRPQVRSDSRISERRRGDWGCPDDAEIHIVGATPNTSCDLAGLKPSGRARDGRIPLRQSSRCPWLHLEVLRRF